MSTDDDPLDSLRRGFLARSETTADAERRTREMADRLFGALAGLPEEVRFLGRPADEIECAAMLESLPLFEQLAVEAGLYDRYQPLADRCRLHFTSYRRFLQLGSPGGSYAEFRDEPGQS